MQRQHRNQAASQGAVVLHETPTAPGPSAAHQDAAAAPGPPAAPQDAAAGQEAEHPRSATLWGERGLGRLELWLKFKKAWFEEQDGRGVKVSRPLPLDAATRMLETDKHASMESASVLD
ncbi:hypothetical protein NDU88_000780 [Pleurodeles waltl]|uniref:Uncharacterized protein n=1 Tax=Pleurodeles waltl TaxID=8319 RepID=A0AAV7N943_PLEWA|nr:hypothetical protein NDU88_000780 [Pleurodeles waltl]